MRAGQLELLLLALVLFDAVTTAVNRLWHSGAANKPTLAAGYYSRYAALRNLLLQFLALGAQQPDGSGHGGSGSGSGGQTGGITAQEPQQAVGTPSQQTQQPREQEQQQQQQQQPHADVGQGDGSQPGSGAQAQPAAWQEGGGPLRRQVLVLGAGYDTAYFQLAADGIRADKYIEVDFLQASASERGAAWCVADCSGSVPRRAAHGWHPTGWLAHGGTWLRLVCIAVERLLVALPLR